MKKTSVTYITEISEFLKNCPNNEGDVIFYPCITECFKNNNYNSTECKKAKEEYYDSIKKSFEGNTK